MTGNLSVRYGYSGNKAASACMQLSLFDIQLHDQRPPALPQLQVDINFDNYSAERYLSDVRTCGLSFVWDKVLEHIFNFGESELLSPRNFGMLYEMGLAEQDKNKKKECGQYFTPEDVSGLMSRWLKDLDGVNVCDVGCGTGNLILSYLKEIGRAEAENLLKNKRVYLYDSDETALKIARYSVALIYGKKYLNNINIICGDFLDKSIALPNNAKVITNPPYAKINDIKATWERTANISSSMDFYAAFMEKIANSGARAVVISPYSFLGGSKFYPLRKALNEHNGFIVSFDNVPGNIFNGRKHGIFNTNTANSVRAAITVIENKGDEKGFRTSHLVRFKNEERAELLSNGLLYDLVGEKRQVVSQTKPSYAKCYKELENVFYLWTSKSDERLSDLLSAAKTQYALYVPNTCRYFTAAAVSELDRKGVMTLYAKNEQTYNYIYCLLNSSFAYWYWRIYDGGITYPRGLLEDIPVFASLLSDDDRLFVEKIREEMSAQEREYVVTKLNAGTEQENIKFPPTFRNKINSRFFRILGSDDDHNLLDLVHSNTVFTPS